MTSSRRRRWIVLSVVVTGLVVVAGVVSLLLAIRAAHDGRAARLQRELRDAIGDYHAHHRGPALHRGAALLPPEHGNAAEAQEAAARPFAGVELDRGAIDALARGRPPGERAIALVRAHAADLDAFRATARFDHAFTDVPLAAGGTAHLAEYRPRLEAIRLLVVRGAIEGPDACLDAGAVSIRIAHDLVPGGLLLSAMIAAAAIEDVARVVAACAPRASQPARARAADAFAELARRAPGLSSTAEAEALMTTATLAISAIEAPWFPTSAYELEHALDRGDMLEAGEAVLRSAATFRAVEPRCYPTCLDLVRHDAARRAASPNRYLAITGDYDRYLARELRAHARVRALAVALAALAPLETVEAPLPGDPPDAASRPELADPFSGRPFRLETTPAELHLIHTGADGVTSADDEDALVIALR